MQFRDLHRQYDTLKPQMDEALLRVAQSGSYIMGKEVEVLEQQLADYVGVRHCITCASGTDALRLALMVWNIGPGDAVFVPDFTFFASAEAVALQGAVPVFVDVDPKTYNIEVSDLEKKYNKICGEGQLNPRAVIGVDLFGQPAEWNGLRFFAEQHKLYLLEDAAQGFGGVIGNCRAGSFGDISATSFFPAKPLGCYGDGGAIFTDNQEWDSLLRSLRQHGKGNDKYDNVRIGINSRLDAMQAAVLQVKLKAFVEHELDDVNTVAFRYHELLDNKGISLPMMPESFSSSWAQYTVCIPNRDAVRQLLMNEGIPTMVYYPRPMHAQTAFAAVHSVQGPCPNADRLASSVLSLPISPYMLPDETQLVAKKLLAAVTIDNDKMSMI
ncbi:MAG: DegT/DnrJ/EryC1/StrS family aminotransferase [bacterium]